MSLAPPLADPAVAELVEILGEDGVLTDRPARLNRSRVPAPFALHRWAEFAPDAVVLPRTAEQVSEIVKLANRLRVPVVPRAGGTGLADGAVPLRGGIVVDVKRMDRILEIDLDDRTVTVQPGVNMLKLNERLRPHGVFYPDNPASYPCSLVGGRIGTNGWSLLGARYGHVRDLVVSMQLVLPTGEIVDVIEGGSRKVRKSSSGYNLKHLFFGHQGTLGIVTEATLELAPRPEAEFSAFFHHPRFGSAFDSAVAISRSGLATLAGVFVADERKLDFLRRGFEDMILQPHEVKAFAGAVLYGTEDEVRAASRRVMRVARETGGTYMGDEISQGDWAARHDHYAIPLQGRLKSGQVVPLAWHCEDASIPSSALVQCVADWHAAIDRTVERYEIFDNWGVYAYTNAAYKPWADWLVEADVGIWEQELEEETWRGWVDCKRAIAEATLRHGGSISAAHGSTREGDVELVPRDIGANFDLMKKIKRTLDPNNVMNPGKYLLDLAYED
jgi:glycolate oxidase